MDIENLNRELEYYRTLKRAGVNMVIAANDEILRLEINSKDDKQDGGGDE